MTRQTTHWLFDLDETLHHAGHMIFPMISEQMTRYIMQHLSLAEHEASALRIDYWQRYGATLTGLQRHHAINSSHFLRDTHDLDVLLPLIQCDPRLPALFRRLPGRKWIFSNGPRHYVEAIVSHLGLRNQTDGIFAFEHLPKAKPNVRAFRSVLRQAGISAGNCIMIEDSADNLKTAKQLGMKTVWLHNKPVKPDWVDYRIRDIGELARLATSNNQ